MEEICLVHHIKWRGRFQHMLNKLRTEILPKTCVRQFQTLVCICDVENCTGGRHFRIPKDFDFSAISNLPKPVETILEDLSKKHVWSSKCNHSDSECQCARSVKLMLYFISLVVTDTFKFINQDEDKKTEKCMVTENFVVDNLPPKHLGLMIGSNGKHIRRFESQYGCSLKLSKEEDTLVTVSVTFAPSQHDILDDLMTDLSSAANKIVAKRLQHNKRVTEYHRMKQRLHKQTHKAITEAASPQDSMKNLNWINYEKKTAAHNKERQSQLQVPARLEGSRCLYCLEHYSKQSFDEASCRYHPGFLVPQKSKQSEKLQQAKSSDIYEWSCCNTESDSRHPDNSQHKMSGCSMGIHNWRCDRKKKQSSSSHTDLTKDAFLI